jgi:FKBP-type peptidyl-prolyl cis-trans isomerase FkpA
MVPRRVFSQSFAKGPIMLRHVALPGHSMPVAFWRSASVVAALAVFALGASAIPTAKAQTAAPPTPAQGVSKLDAMPKDLQKIDVKQGSGVEAVAGKIAVVHYTGWLYDPAKPDGKGAKFDSSRDSGKSFEFPLGGGRVIKGWDQGVVGMTVGGQRTLIIPPDMGYGARGAGGVIPPNATLIFDVELLDVK